MAQLRLSIKPTNSEYHFGDGWEITMKSNKELFENAPPYMIIRPFLMGGLYMSAGKISKLVFKLT